LPAGAVVTTVAIVATAAVVVVLGAGWKRRLAPSHRATSLPAEPRVRRPGRWTLRLARRRPAAGPIEAAAWCDDAARALRAGSALASAIAAATAEHRAMAPVLEPVVTAVARGRALSEALRRAIGDPTTPGGLVMTVLTSCAELGGPAASPLERVAATLRTRAAIADEQRAHSAQARLSAKVMTLVPVGLLALLAATESTVRAAIITPAGAAAIGAGAALNAVGWWWMRAITGDAP
jgi:tight adherence protein B